MAKQVMTLGTIAQMDMGRIGAAFDAELERAVKDMIDRPREPSKRRVTLTVTLAPEGNSDDHGVCDEAAVEFHVASNVPKRKTRAYSAAVNAKGTIRVNEASPDNVKQHTLDEAAGGSHDA